MIGYDTDISEVVCITSGKAAEPGDALTNSLPKGVDAIVLYQVVNAIEHGDVPEFSRAQCRELPGTMSYVGAYTTPTTIM